MAIEVFNRYESKYLVDFDTLNKIQERLQDYMELDSYNKEHEFYTISNIYCDTEDNALIRNSLSKPQYKEKLRLRAYGVPDKDSKVYLEIKKKFSGIVNKRRTTLKLQEAYDFINTGIQPEIKKYMNRQVLNEIEYLLGFYELKPKVYLAYDRKAMFCRNQHDLRITFDTNIRSRRYDLKLEKGDYGEPLLEKNLCLMEIKAEKTLPLWLVRMLSENKIFKTSFSKYGKEYQNMLIKNRIEMEDTYLCLNQYSAQPQLIPQYL